MLPDNHLTAVPKDTQATPSEAYKIELFNLRRELTIAIRSVGNPDIVRWIGVIKSEQTSIEEKKQAAEYMHALLSFFYAPHRTIADNFIKAAQECLVSELADQKAAIA